MDEFDDVQLEAIFGDEEEDYEQPHLDIDRASASGSATTDSSNQQAETATNSSQSTKKKKRIPRPKSTYTLAKATEEQTSLLQESVQDIYNNEFVCESTFLKSAIVKTYAEECLKQLRAGAAQLLEFAMIIQLLWPAIQKADCHSTGPARSEAAISEFYQLRIRADTKRVVSAFFHKLIATMDVPHHFLQMFLRVMFEKLLLKHEHIEKKDKETSLSFQPNVREQNALRYVAGYIVFKLPKKILFKKEREQMETVLHNMKEEALQETRLSYTKEWIEAQSRGGLCNVNDKTFLFFQKLEEIVRKKFPSDTQVMKHEDLRERLPMQPLKTGPF